MKKLMIAAAAVAVAGGAFATPLVYDYRSSVKHMYEREQRVSGTTFYVKYVKTSKIEGFFIQDVDGATTLAKSDLVNGYNGAGGGPTISQKRGFLVVMNRSAERDYRRPKIMPAQLDVKGTVTRVSGSGTTVRSSMVYEAYFYAGPFASAPDTNAQTTWTASQDDGVDYLIFNSAIAAGGGNAGGAGPNNFRTYGTMGSTLYLFGQHNTYNRWDNTLAQPAVCAFGDGWLNGAGFGTGGLTSTACCGWGSAVGGFRSLSGNLKGGLFLCSLGGYVANSQWGYFALGLEELWAADVNAVLGHTVQQDNPGVTNPVNGNNNLWADGDIALATTDVVSGTWTLRPRTARFNPVALTANEIAWFAGTGAPSWPNSQEVATYVKAANENLLQGYDLIAGGTAAVAGDQNQPENRNGQNTVGLIPFNFAFIYF